MAKKLKILFVAEVSHIGGASTVIEELANQMCSFGHFVVIMQGYDREKKNWSQNYLNPLIKVYNYEVDFRGNVRVFLTLFKNIWSLFGFLGQKYEFDIVFLNYAYSAGITCLYPLFRKKTKIFLFHGDEPKIMWSLIPKPRKHKILGTIKRIILSGPFILICYLAQRIALSKSSFVVGFSKYTIKTLKNNLCVPCQKIRTTHLGVNTLFFTPPLKNKSTIKEMIGFSTNTKIILCTSRFEPRKGIDLLIKAFSQIVKQNPSVRLFLASPIDEYYLQSYYYTSLIEQINRLRLSPYIHFLYNLTRHELIRYYQAADVLVFPSRFLETFGLIALEALACGTPVVCYAKSGAPPEIVKQISPQLIFKKYQPENLAQKITSALKEGPSFKKQGLALVKKYSWTKSASYLLSLVQQY